MKSFALVRNSESKLSTKTTQTRRFTADIASTCVAVRRTVWSVGLYGKLFLSSELRSTGREKIEARGSAHVSNH